MRVFSPHPVRSALQRARAQRPTKGTRVAANLSSQRHASQRLRRTLRRRLDARGTRRRFAPLHKLAGGTRGQPSGLEGKARTRYLGRGVYLLQGALSHRDVTAAVLQHRLDKGGPELLVETADQLSAPQLSATTARAPRAGRRCQLKQPHI
jgi:hypothetical protein